MKYHDRPWLSHYPVGFGPEIEVPDIGLVDHFEAIAAEFSQLPATHFLGMTLTYQELMALSNRFAQCLVQNGVQPGDVVGINLPNSPQYLIAQLGTLKAGCAASGVSPLLTSGEMLHQLKDSRAKVLVTLDAIFELRFLPISQDLTALSLVIVTGILDFLPWYKRLAGRILKKVPHGKVQPVSGKTVFRLTDILSNYPDRDPDVKVKPEDHCLIMYTGGTTGTPKGTVITHRNMVAELAIVTGWLDMELGREVILSAFPLFHIAGLALGLGTMFIGSVQILIPNPRDTRHIVREMARYHPTILVNVPALYMMLLSEPTFKKLDFSRLNFCLSAASPFPTESIAELEQVIGPGKVLECYGMTEVSSLSTMNPRRGTRKLGTVGVPLPNTRIKVVDLETRSQEVPVGHEGEIITSGPQVMKEYLNQPEETALVLKDHSGETWLHTGDVGRMDEDGFLTIVDRAKDMVNVGGFKVFSREVEEKLYEHHAIEFCAIIGIPNPKRPGNEIVKLVVEPSLNSAAVSHEKLREQILAFASENLAPYKVPKIIEFVNTMPLTAVGKVDKKALR